MEDYRVLVELVDEDLDQESIYINVMKLRSNKDHDLEKYETIFQKVVSPFAIKEEADESSLVHLKEVTYPLKLNEYELKENKAKDIFLKNQENKKGETETLVSRGFCLTISDIGYILISHNGDIILQIYDKVESNPNKKSLHIESPKQVILNTTYAKYLNLDIISTATVLSGKCHALLSSLKFSRIGNDESINGIFIDQGSTLNVNIADIQNSSLLVLGTFTIDSDFSINNGYIFNMGNIKFFGENVKMTDIPYFFNGKNGNLTFLKTFYINAHIFSNLGTIDLKDTKIDLKEPNKNDDKIPTLNIQKAFDNQGKIISSSSLKINGENEAINQGTIKCINGLLLIDNKRFLHKQGELNILEIEISAESTLIEAKILGRKGIFHYYIINNEGSIHLNELYVSGILANNGSLTLTEKLQLEDDSSQVQNKTTIETGEIVSNSKKGLIIGGRITADSIKVNSYLQVNCNFPNLDYIEVKPNGILVISPENLNPKLKRITNNGKASILSQVQNLETIENTDSAYIELKTKTYITKINSFNTLKGTSIIQAKFLTMKRIVVPSTARINLIEGTQISNADTIIVQENSVLEIHKDVLLKSNLNSIYNFGEIISFIPLKINSIYNGPKASLKLLNETTVYGRGISNDDENTFNIKNYLSLIDDSLKLVKKIDEEINCEKQKIGLYNEGKILVTILNLEKNYKCDTSFGFNERTTIQFFSDEDSEGKQNFTKGLNIKSTYVGSKESILKIENFGSVIAEKYINFGMIFSPDMMKIVHTSSTDILGTVSSKNGIDFKSTVSPLIFNESFRTIITNENKMLNIHAKKNVVIIGSNNWDANVQINANKIECKGKLSAKSLNAEINEFYIEKRKEDKNSILVQDYYKINTCWFMNDGGILKADDCKNDSIIIASKMFQNTGGGDFSYDHQTISWFSFNKKEQLKSNLGQLNTRMYQPHFDESGLVKSGGKLKIIVESFDNCFGIINGATGLEISSTTILNNECGLIYSGGITYIKGNDMNNGQIFNQKNSSNFDDHQTPEYIIKRARNEQNNSSQSMQINFGSTYPGYIFSVGDLDIQLQNSIYFGTIVSKGNITIKGTKHETKSTNEFGTIIAKGNIDFELNQIKLEQSQIFAQNVMINLVKDLASKGVVSALEKPDGQFVEVIDLVKFAKYLGIKTNSTKSLINTNNQSIIPKPIFGQFPISNFDVFETSSAGFINSAPESNFFIPAIENSVLNQLIQLTLAPYGGRDILLHIDLVNELKEKGTKVIDSVSNSRDIVLKDGDPALIFQKIENQSVEMEIKGEKVEVPLCNPYLVMDVFTRFISQVKAAKSINIQTLGNINIKPDDFAIESENVTLKAQEKITIASEYTWSGNKRIGIKRAGIKAENDLTLSGNKGIETRAAELNAKTISIKSESGDIFDFDMPLDMEYIYDSPQNNVHHYLGHQDTFNSQIKGEHVEISAPNGIIKHQGTNIIAGDDGIKIEAQKYEFNPSVTHDSIIEYDGNKTNKIDSETPKQGGLITSGNIIFMTKDASLVGATVVGSRISNPTDGDFKFLPAYATQHVDSTEKVRNLLGKSTTHLIQDQSIPIGCQIIANEFEFLGLGTLEMEEVTAEIVNATITKNLEERAAYETNHTVITQHSSGLCPPKISGDCFLKSIQNASSSMKCYEDAIPTAFNLIGEFCQTMEHIEILKNLTYVENPLVSISQIFLSRFVTSFSFGNSKTTIKTDEKTPHQSQVNIEVLTVSNDRTHLEGKWCINQKGSIETKELTSKAPEHVFHQETKTSGYNISLSPAAVFGAFMAPSPLTLEAFLPNVSISKSSTKIDKKDHVAQVLTADDLFIRCDNAIFSGSTIQARLVEAIVSGDLTIEDIKSEFQSEMHSTNVGVSLAGVFNLVKSISTSNAQLESLRNEAKNLSYKTGMAAPGILADTTFLNPALKAIPQVRFVNEKSISKEVQNLSSLIGKEKFYLHVGNLLHKKSALIGCVQPDGVINESNQKIDVGKTIDEKIKETHVHKKHIINPCISEFVGMMSSYQSWQQVSENFEIQRYQDELKSGKRQKDALMEAKIKTKKTLQIIDSADEKLLKSLIRYLRMINKIQSMQANQSRNNSKSKMKKNKRESEDQKDEPEQNEVDDQKDEPEQNEVDDQKDEPEQNEVDDQNIDDIIETDQNDEQYFDNNEDSDPDQYFDGYGIDLFNDDDSDLYINDDDDDNDDPDPYNNDGNDLDLYDDGNDNNNDPDPYNNDGNDPDPYNNDGNDPDPYNNNDNDNEIGTDNDSHINYGRKNKSHRTCLLGLLKEREEKESQDNNYINEDLDDIQNDNKMEAKYNHHQNKKNFSNQCTSKFSKVLKVIDSLNEADKYIEKEKKNIELEEYNKSLNEGCDIKTSKMKSKEKSQTFESDMKNIKLQSKNLENQISAYIDNSISCQIDNESSKQQKKEIKPSPEKVSSSEPKYYVEAAKYPELTPQERLEKWYPKNDAERIAKAIVEFKYKCNDIADKYPKTTNFLGNLWSLFNNIITLLTLGTETIAEAAINYGLDFLINEFSGYVTPDEYLKQELATTLICIKDLALTAKSTHGFIKNCKSGKPFKDTYWEKLGNNASKYRSMKAETNRFESPEPKASFKDNSYLKQPNTNVKVTYENNSYLKQPNTNVKVNYENNSYLKQPNTNVKATYENNSYLKQPNTNVKVTYENNSYLKQPNIDVKATFGNNPYFKQPNTNVKATFENNSYLKQPNTNVKVTFENNSYLKQPNTNVKATYENNSYLKQPNTNVKATYENNSYLKQPNTNVKATFENNSYLKQPNIDVKATFGNNPYFKQPNINVKVTYENNFYVKQPNKE